MNLQTVVTDVCQKGTRRHMANRDTGMCKDNRRPA